MISNFFFLTPTASLSFADDHYAAITKHIQLINSSPPGSPSHTSSQSYLQSPSPPGRGSFSRSKVRKVMVTSMLGGTMMMKEHSRLWGYLSGKPGDSTRPVGLVKLREQSEPEMKTQTQNVYEETYFFIETYIYSSVWLV